MLGQRKCADRAGFTVPLRRVCGTNGVSQNPSATTQNEPGTRGQPARNSGSNAHLWVLAAIAALLIGLFVGYVAGDLPVERQSDSLTMSQCVTGTLGLFGLTTPPMPEILRHAVDHCYSLIQAQQLLSDFSIRKLNYFQQYRANGILMSMVVAVTLSGVLLAGIQLWVSYQLAAANRTALSADSSELILERGQLILKSSITGLFILLVSFCFFLVFVLYVYRLEPPVDGHSIASPVPTLPSGGLGPPEKSKP